MATKRLRIVGLGPGNPGSLTVDALQAMTGKAPVFLRTRVHPTVPYLITQGISFTSFDDVYDQLEDFAAIYKEICRRLQ